MIRVNSRLLHLPVNVGKRSSSLVRKICSKVDELGHTPVLLKEVAEAFKKKDLRVFLDCTLGAAGHTSSLIEQHSELETVIGIDVDEVAIRLAETRLTALAVQRENLKIHLLNGNFRNLARLLMNYDQSLVRFLDGGFDGILMDLGMSSMQVDDAGRGFSFMKDGPLDMKMGPSAAKSAEEVIPKTKTPRNQSIYAQQILNTWSEFELGKLFREYGEERRWKSIAKRVCIERERNPITTTGELVRVIGPYYPDRRRKAKHIHPATRVFQALRISVNDELENIRQSLPFLLNSLSPGGILCVISFHSLEDRIVKMAFMDAAGQRKTMPGVPLQMDNRFYGFEVEEAIPFGRIVTKKPVRPTEAEMESNARSRSAKLRVFERYEELEL